MLRPFRARYRGWPVTQGDAQGFAFRFALGYILPPFQGEEKGLDSIAALLSPKVFDFLRKTPFAGCDFMFRPE